MTNTSEPQKSVRKYRRQMEPLERFMSKVEKNEWSGCWLWKGYLDKKGYGYFSMNGKTTTAHRCGYELIVEPVSPNLVIDHLCKNRSCVNPQHLEPITARANQLRDKGFAAEHARKTHCIRGHEFTPENTRMAARDQGARYARLCLACEKIRGRKVA